MFIKFRRFLNLRNKNIPNSSTNEENYSVDDLLNTGIQYDYHFLEICRDCTLKEFVFADQLLHDDITTYICNGTLIDDSIHHLSKKKIFVIRQGSLLYNIYTNEELIYIDERETLDNGEIKEKTIKINRKNNLFKISLMMHTKELSTYDIKFYNSNSTKIDFFHMEEVDALNTFCEVLNNLRLIPNINKIIDLEKLKYIYDFFGSSDITGEKLENIKQSSYSDKEKYLKMLKAEDKK